MISKILKVVGLFTALTVHSLLSASAVEKLPAPTVKLPPTVPKSANVPNQTFDHWKVICADGKCRMAQSLVSKSSRTQLLRIRIHPGKQPIMVVTFPLGILLSPGWRMRTDKKKERLYPFEICNFKGCHAGIKLSSVILKEFRGGNKTMIKIFDSKNKMVKLQVSLKGFSKAYKALTKAKSK